MSIWPQTDKEIREDELRKLHKQIDVYHDAIKSQAEAIEALKIHIATQDAEINRLTALVASRRVEIAKGEEAVKLLAEVHDNIVVMQCYYFLATRIKNLLTRVGYVPPKGDEG